MKQLWRIILLQLGRWGLAKYVTLGLLSGLFSFLFINSVTRMVSQFMTGGMKTVHHEYIIAFAAIILLYVWIRRTLALKLIDVSQRLFWSLRKQVLSLILKANYQQLRSRKARIYAVLVNDVNVLTNTSLSLIEFTTSTIVALACLVYLMTISMPLFLITLGIALLGVTVYVVGSGRNNAHFEKARNLEDGFIERLNSILNGFKEIYMEPRKGRAIYDQKVRRIAGEAYRNNTAAFTGFLNNQITGQVLFYLLISSVLLVFSIQLDIKPEATVNYVFILLYLLSSIEAIMVLLPTITRARVASGRLMQLKQELEHEELDNPIPERSLTLAEFRSLGASGLEFQYGEGSSETSFGIGPINFEVRKGETVFIYGGNGSGKTTFVFSLLGLWKPTAGHVSLNGIPVTGESYPEYRAIFSVVFSDFYLFDEVLVEGHFNADRWDHYLELFEMQGKVNMEEGRFSTTDLSTGQRKRLALICALMEEKPVLVIDEWAADQDPYFRKKFYTQILPVLKDEGVTVIAITHDDKYYHCADRLYRMDYGRLQEEEVNVQESSAVS